MATLFKRVELTEGTLVQYLGVYALKWRPEWGEPQAGFNSIDSEAVEIIEDCRDLARTGLCPDVLNLSPEQWAQHKLDLIASKLSSLLQGIEKS